MNNPFKFGKEVTGDQFYDRAEDARILRQKLLDGSSNVVLFAPRRYGKTSLVLKVLTDLFQQDGVKSVCFDLTRVQTLERFCRDYANAVIAAVGGGLGLAHRALSLLSHLNPELSIGVGDAFKVQLHLNPAFGTESLAEVLDLPEKLMSGKEESKPLVIAFDEFQEVASLSRKFPLEKIFRSCIQLHQRVHYVFFGSKTHLMARMFGDETQPFYNSAYPLPLKKPPQEESVEFLVSRFASVEIAVSGEAAKAIVSQADNVPYYLQAIASEIFEARGDAGGDIGIEDVQCAVEAIVMKNAELYDVRLEGMSASKRALLHALAEEPVRVFGEEYRRRHELPVSSTLHTVLRELIDAGVIHDDSGAYAFADPFFASYLRKPAARIFGESRGCVSKKSR